MRVQKAFPQMTAHASDIEISRFSDLKAGFFSVRKNLKKKWDGGWKIGATFCVVI
jgi:hypothetical protein